MLLVVNKVQMIMRCISAAGLLAQVLIVCFTFSSCFFILSSTDSYKHN